MRSILLLALAGCTSDEPAKDEPSKDAPAGDTDAATADTDAPTAPTGDTVGGDRPASLFVPAGWDGESALPLVILLHGYGASGLLQDEYFGISDRVDALGFVLVTPDGTAEPGGTRFWNATEACCDFQGTDVDDVAYLDGIVDEVQAMMPIDRVYFLGHSNGGFMSYRMACESSERISAIASLAGTTFSNEDDCGATGPVDVLQIHGTDDTTIVYDGTLFYPGAEETVTRWADRAGCRVDPTETGRLDLDSAVDGDETVALQYTDGCDTDVELWRMDASGHIPLVTDAFADGVLGWLLAHP